MIDEKKTSSSVRRRALSIKKTRKVKRLIPSVVGLIAATLIIAYVASLLFSQYGSFTITIKDGNDGGYALALSENASFKLAASRLRATEARNIDNITYSDLPNDLNDIDGSHNGANYLAYTFYLKNVGTKECSYRYSLVVSEATANVDAAIRTRIYFNADFYKAETEEYSLSGAYVDYAKPKTGGNGLPEIDPGNRVMTNFFSSNVVAQGITEKFAPGDMSKITVVIWLEGEDPDCTDDILGGRFKTDMNIEIVGANE